MGTFPLPDQLPSHGRPRRTEGPVWEKRRQHAGAQHGLCRHPPRATREKTWPPLGLESCRLRCSHGRPIHPSSLRLPFPELAPAAWLPSGAGPPSPAAQAKAGWKRPFHACFSLRPRASSTRPQEAARLKARAGGQAAWVLPPNPLSDLEKVKVPRLVSRLCHTGD